MTENTYHHPIRHHVPHHVPLHGPLHAHPAGPHATSDKGFGPDPDTTVPQQALNKIYEDVTTLRNGNSTDATKFRSDLYDLSTHNPGTFQASLEKINLDMHMKGVLPDFNVVGVQGDSIVAKQASGTGQIGSLHYLDSTDLKKDVSIPVVPGQTSNLYVGGREATRALDGSGTIIVKPGDNPSYIARDILQQQNPESTVDNSMVNNYVRGMNELNPGMLKNLQPGQRLDLPPANSARLNESQVKSDERAALDDIQKNVFDSPMFNRYAKLDLNGFYLTKSAVDTLVQNASSYSGSDKNDAYPEQFINGLKKLQTVWGSPDFKGVEHGTFNDYVNRDSFKQARDAI